MFPMMVRGMSAAQKNPVNPQSCHLSMQPPCPFPPKFTSPFHRSLPDTSSSTLVNHQPLILNIALPPALMSALLGPSCSRQTSERLTELRLSKLDDREIPNGIPRTSLLGAPPIGKVIKTFTSAEAPACQHKQGASSSEEVEGGFKGELTLPPWQGGGTALIVTLCD